MDTFETVRFLPNGNKYLRFKQNIWLRLIHQKVEKSKSLSV